MGTLFGHRVRALLLALPPGRVISYGKLAELAGWPRHARHIARVLVQADDLPWQRVVCSDGRLSRRGSEAADWQRVLLEAEGVCFDGRGRVRMDCYAWDGDEKVCKAALCPRSKA